MGFRNTVVGRAGTKPVMLVGADGIPEPNSPHAHIHNGDYGVASFYRESSAAVFDVVVQAGTKELHAFSEITFQENARVQFFHNPTYTGGAIVQPTNRDLGSSKVPTFSLVAEPTVTDTGDEIYPDKFLSGGSGNFASGGTAGGNVERKIPIGDSVLVRMTPLSGAQIVSYTVEAYEEDE